MEVVWELSPALAKRFRQMEQEAYSHLVAGNFEEAEKIYKQQYEIFRLKEQRLSVDEKYHKGGPLHNWGISLLFQKKNLLGFQKITLAYIEDLLDLPNIDDALVALAYKTLRSYPLISDEFLDRLKKLAIQRREQNRIPRDPEEVMREYRKKGYTDLASLEKPVTLEQFIPLIQSQLEGLGPREKRVFVGGSYRNIALLRYIAFQIVQNFDDFKAILPIDLPKLSSETYDHLTHDVSMEYLEGCSYAIFEVSTSNGHLMEIERASMIRDLEVLLVFQQRKADYEPAITKMVLTTNFKKEGYQNFAELTTKIGRFLGIV